jgi:hypothetical protein
MSYYLGLGQAGNNLKVRNVICIEGLQLLYNYNYIILYQLTGKREFDYTTECVTCRMGAPQEGVEVVCG